MLILISVAHKTMKNYLSNFEVNRTINSVPIYDKSKSRFHDN